ncbi:MAG: hypothetical protein ACRDFS_10865 [Chloroflexota bacterium]
MTYLAFEWLKMRKRWMARVIILLTLGLMVLAFWGEATRVSDQVNLLPPRAWLTALILGAFFAPFFWPVLGGSWAGNEFSWGTVRLILTHRPSRMARPIMGLIMLAITVGIALILALVVSTIAGAVIAGVTGHSAFVTSALSGTFFAVLVKGFLAAWYVSLFYILLAYCAGTFFQSTAVGIGIGIGSTLAELIVRGIFDGLGGWWKIVGDHFPAVYTQDLATRVVNSQLTTSAGGVGQVAPGTPSAGQSVIAIAIYMAIFLALTLWVVRVRDVTA